MPVSAPIASWSDPQAPPIEAFDAAVPGDVLDDVFASGLVWNAYIATHPVKTRKYAWKYGRYQFGSTGWGRADAELIAMYDGEMGMGRSDDD